MTDDRQYLPFVADNLPEGVRPMIALLHAVHGHENALTDAVATLATAVRAEPGCIEFRAFRGVDNPGEFHLYEIYSDVDAFRLHLTTPHVAHFFTELAQHSTADASALTQLVEVE